jgi:hypothetical protein
MGVYNNLVQYQSIFSKIESETLLVRIFGPRIRGKFQNYSAELNWQFASKYSPEKINFRIKLRKKLDLPFHMRSYCLIDSLNKIYCYGSRWLLISVGVSQLPLLKKKHQTDENTKNSIKNNFIKLTECAKYLENNPNKLKEIIKKDSKKFKKIIKIALIAIAILAFIVFMYVL